MKQYKQQFIDHIGAKNKPNSYEKGLFEKTQKYSKYFSKIPGVQMIAICNSLSMYATKERASDIDLFIVTKPHSIWFVRFCITILSQVLWVRRYGDKVADRFCLSFFATTDLLDMSKIAIKDDIYLYYWVYFLKPIYDAGGVYEYFLEQNKWVEIDKKQKQQNLVYCNQFRSTLNFSTNTCIKVGDWLCKKILKPKTQRTYQNLHKPFGVIISDDMLKFHDNDQRKIISKKICK